MKLSQRWKQTSLSNKLMVWTTCLVAFGTLFYAAAAAWQGYILRQSGEQAARQTNKLIAASERLANTANTAVEEAQRSNAETANRLERMTRANEEFANAARKEANASEVSAKAAEQSSRIAAQSLSIGERAYIGISNIEVTKPVVGQYPVVTITYINSGRTPAFHFFTQARISLSRYLKETSFWNPLTKLEKIGSFLPAGTERRVAYTATTWAFTEETRSLLNHNILKLFVQAEARYVDSLGRMQVFTICAVYLPSEGQFTECY